MEKMSKMKILVFFFAVAIFRALELAWNVKKKHQILAGCSILCITSLLILQNGRRAVNHAPHIGI